jgi:hypothetical protein
MIWTTLSENPPDVPEDRGETLPLRSLYPDCAVDVAIAALGTVSLLPFASQAPAGTTVNRVTETLYEVSAGLDRLLIGVQAIADHRTALHLVINGSPELYQGTGQRHFLDWALRLRHAIEHPPKAEFAPRSVTAEAM